MNLNIHKKTPAQRFTEKIQIDKQNGILQSKTKKQEKRLILSICTETNPDYKEIKEVFLTRAEPYAKKCSADIKFMDESFSKEPVTNPKLLKKYIGNFFDEYDRILYIDLDVLIANDAPNVFDLYPGDCLYAVNEKYFFEKDNKYDFFLNYVQQYNEQQRFNNQPILSFSKLSNDYYHPGVFLCTKKTNPYKYNYITFKQYNAADTFQDSHFFNFMIRLHGIKTKEMDRSFNFLVSYILSISNNPSSVHNIDSAENYNENFIHCNTVLDRLTNLKIINQRFLKDILRR